MNAQSRCPLPDRQRVDRWLTGLIVTILLSIAIDGPVASGKTTVGKHLAQRLGTRFLDTGAMYRAVTWAATQQGIDFEDEEGLSRLANTLSMNLASPQGDSLRVDGQDVSDHLRDPEVERGVSRVAKVPGVRSAMVAQQRTIAQQGPIVVMGRDIGTVVLPQASLKVFLTASVQVRAQRRLVELQGNGETPDYALLVQELVRRDRIDSERDDSPLRVAEDAFTIDTENTSIEQVVDVILSRVGEG